MRYGQKIVRIRVILAALFALLAAALPARAQYVGSVSFQSVQTTIATNLACTGSPQLFVTGSVTGFDNLGQTQHNITLITPAVPGTLQAEIDGIDKQGNIFRISDVLENPGVTTSSLTGTGFFPKIQIKVTCAIPGTFTLSYSGTSVSNPSPVGSYQAGQIDKFEFNLLTLGSNATDTFQTPFGNSAGVIAFNPSGAPPASSSINVQCAGVITSAALYSFPLPTTTGQKFFPVPTGPCSFATVTYVSGGASAQTFQLEYIFAMPGFTPNAGTGTYTHVTTTTATAAKATGGFLHTLNVNTAAAGTISIFDLPTASCTGTPATNVVAVITVPAATNGLPPFIYDVNLLQGICVKASVAMDFTVSAN